MPMKKTTFKNARWLGLIGLIFILTIVPSLLAQIGKAKTATSTTAASKVDINSAARKDLETLPGVGEATAKKIIAGRPYASIDDLAKAGVSKSVIAKITPLVMVGAAT